MFGHFSVFSLFSKVVTVKLPHGNDGCQIRKDSGVRLCRCVIHSCHHQHVKWDIVAITPPAEDLTQDRAQWPLSALVRK